MRVLDKIKAVWRKMLGKDEISRLFDIQNVERSAKMETALHLYKDMRTNIPNWCGDGIETVRFSNTICREIANLTCFNISLQVSDPYLQGKVDDVGMVRRSKANMLNRMGEVEETILAVKKEIAGQEVLHESLLGDILVRRLPS